jgi:smad nuclear-interacting protein 1
MIAIRRPYVIDLGSSNGTMLNGTRVEPQRYYELKAQDCLKFGFSTREYVLMYGEMEVEGADDA